MSRERCEPPTTPQTIGRLETGTRTVSVGWLNRIADGARGGGAGPGRGRRDSGAQGRRGSRRRRRACAPRAAAIVVPPRADAGQVAMTRRRQRRRLSRRRRNLVRHPASRTITRRALNRDVLVPRPAGRFLFGRLINRDDEKLQILPLEAGGRQQVVANPPGWRSRPSWYGACEPSRKPADAAPGRAGTTVRGVSTPPPLVFRRPAPALGLFVDQRPRPRSRSYADPSAAAPWLSRCGLDRSRRSACFDGARNAARSPWRPGERPRPRSAFKPLHAQSACIWAWRSSLSPREFATGFLERGRSAAALVARDPPSIAPSSRANGGLSQETLSGRTI